MNIGLYFDFEFFKESLCFINFDLVLDFVIKVMFCYRINECVDMFFLRYGKFFVSVVSELRMMKFIRLEFFLIIIILML